MPRAIISTVARAAVSLRLCAPVRGLKPNGACVVDRVIPRRDLPVHAVLTAANYIHIRNKRRVESLLAINRAIFPSLARDREVRRVRIPAD